MSDRVVRAPSGSVPSCSTEGGENNGDWSRRGDGWLDANDIASSCRDLEFEGVNDIEVCCCMSRGSGWLSDGGGRKDVRPMSWSCGRVRFCLCPPFKCCVTWESSSIGSTLGAGGFSVCFDLSTGCRVRRNCMERKSAECYSLATGNLRLLLQAH